MKVVWKYNLPALPGSGPIEMQQGAQLLKFDVQLDELCLWALVDPGAPVVHRYLGIAETGLTALRDDEKYVGTALLQSGKYVLHLFDRGEV